MKLLTTIAAVLISISAFSQDLIKYENGTFSQNGEELSMEQIDDLTLLHQAGRGNFWRGFRFNRMHKDGDLRINNNTANFLEGAVTGATGGLGVFLGAVLYEFGYIPFIFIPTGGGLCVVSNKAFSRIASSPEECLRKRDKQFNKVADKINQAIAPEEATAQSSNQFRGAVIIQPSN